MNNPDFLTVPAEHIDARLRHVDVGTNPLALRHRDFCLCKFPRVTPLHEGCCQPRVGPAEKGTHFMVDKIRVVTSGFIHETRFVVVKFPAWEALDAAGKFFQAIEDHHPRADIDFARRHPKTAHFLTMDDAVKAAVEALKNQ